MYACIPGTGVGFFVVVCTLRSTTANLYDPPPSIRELDEPILSASKRTGRLHSLRPTT